MLSIASSLGAAFAQQTGQIDVSVQGYDGESTMTASLLDSKEHYLENKTVNTASFSFTNVSVTQPHSIILTYNGVPYTTKVNATKDSPQQVSIRVYELATSDENITISFHHTALSKGDNSVNVTEYIEFVNIGDKVQNGTDLKIFMPQGFKNLRSSHSCCMTKTDFGYFFKIPSPVLPGGTQSLDLSYEISPDTDQYKFEERTYYDTGFVILTIPSSTDFKAVPNSNESIRSEGPVEVQKQTYDAYSAYNVYAGQGYALTVTGFKSTSINVVWVGTGILFAMIAGAVIYGFRGTKISKDKLQTESEALTSVMAELEKDFAEGKVTEVEYLKLKLKYKSRLEIVQSKLQEAARTKVK
ncbi:MAG: hypothetical protein M1503_06200 [Thaumarchaeota archaeon]|nr:hypothetical protein [Nitrososphaerota archaeon]